MNTCRMVLLAALLMTQSLVSGCQGSEECAPDCTDRVCGEDDGCGEMCIGCPAGLVCNTSKGKCEDDCVPQCGASSCGEEDGCGRRCLSCPGGQLCDISSWQCYDPPACGPDSPRSLMSCVGEARYTEDLYTISGERPPGSPHWQEVQDLCAGRFEQFGYQVELQDYGTGVNVLGVLPGSRLPDERILVSAHYDSIPYCPSANDNASGVAGLLELARVLSQTDHARTLVLACWDEEEYPMRGSKAYALLARQRNEILLDVLVFDMIGYRNDEPNSQSYPAGLDLLYPDLYEDLVENQFRGDFTALVSDSLSATLAGSIVQFGAQVGLKVVDIAIPDTLKDSELIADLKLSDHSSFWEAGYPGLHLSDAGRWRDPTYHCEQDPDVPENLDHAFATQAIQASVGAVAEALNRE